jgi:hypothetical protein
MARCDQKDVEKMIGLHMVESDVQATTGLESGAFKEGEYIRVDKTMNRLCAPTDKSKMTSFIFWTKSSPKDNVPTWDKVVRHVRVIYVWDCSPVLFQFGGIVYNLDKLDRAFSSESDALKTEAEAAALHLKYVIFAMVILYRFNIFVCQHVSPAEQNTLGHGWYNGKKFRDTGHIWPVLHRSGNCLSFSYLLYFKPRRF